MDWTVVATDDGAREFAASFPSAIITPHEANNRVPLTVLLPEGEGPFPCVVVLHYLGARDLKVERSLAAELNRRGIAAAIPSLPYHMERTPTGLRSGERALPADVPSLIANMLQSVLDVRRAIDFLSQRPEVDASRIGIAGTSLGSLVSSLVYAVDDRVKPASFMLGGVDLAHILWHSSRVVKQRDDLRKAGKTESVLRTDLMAIEPLSYLSRRKNPEAFVIGAKYDTVIPPADTKKLLEALPGAHSLWLDTGHYGGVLVQKRVLRSVAEFFEASFAGKEFTPPKRISAPTLRVGMIGDTESGLQIGAGIDVWTFDGRGTGMVSLFATPKGPRAFIGLKLDKNLFIGGVAGLKSIAPGLTWSFVL